MNRFDLHRELSLLGVSSEIHALVDDLDLDFGVPCFTMRKILRRCGRELYIKPRCRVYVSHFPVQTIQGRLF